MGVKTSLAAITLTGAEVLAGYVDGEDSAGMVASAVTTVEELAVKLQWIINAIPSGSNATALAAVITSLG